MVSYLAIENEKEALPTSDTSEDADKTGEIVSPENSGNQQENSNELLRTGELFTAEDMETLKAQALSWQSVYAGMRGFAEIVALEPADGTGQQIYVYLDRGALFEKI